jgi:REP element-mobilizing transposase RayT
MARKPRVHFPTALYHVIARGNQRQAIFLDEKDLRTYLSYLSEYKKKHSFHLYSYALMKNHLLLEAEETPLAKIMQVLQFRYTRYFNKRYRKVGHLFQGRYKAILCDKDIYFLELVRYIHLNPVRAGMVRDPEKYSWTGHLSYMGKGKVDLLDKDLALSQFGKSKYLARRQYR